jgi:hypothetical protein
VQPKPRQGVKNGGPKTTRDAAIKAVVSGAAAAVAGAAIESVIDGTDFGDNLISTLPGTLESAGNQFVKDLRRIEEAKQQKAPKPTDDKSKDKSPEPGKNDNSQAQKTNDTAAAATTAAEAGDIVITAGGLRFRAESLSDARATSRGSGVQFSGGKSCSPSSVAAPGAETDIIVTASKGQVAAAKHRGFFESITNFIEDVGEGGARLLGFHPSRDHSLFRSLSSGANSLMAIGRVAGNELGQANARYHLVSRAGSALGVAGGVAEGVVGSGVTAIGLATSEIGIGVPIAVLGGSIVLHAGDQISSHAHRFLSPTQDIQSLTSRAGQKLGLSRSQAETIDTSLNIGFTLGGGIATNSARAGLGIAAGTAGRLAAERVGLKTLGPGWRVIAPAGEGAATGVLPNGYRTVSRWISPKEAANWLAEGGTGIPRVAGSNRMFVTELGAAKPGGTGSIRVDFALPESALQKAGKSEWFQIFQPTPSRPIYNVQIHVPEGTKIPGY